MSAMDFSAVMVAIAQVAVDADVIDRAYDWPNNAINPPCLVVGYPEGPQPFDHTFGRGSDRAIFPAWIIVGAMAKRETRDLLTNYLLPFKAALEGASTQGGLGEPVPWQSIRVQSWSIDPVAVEALDYMAIKFDIDVLT